MELQTTEHLREEELEPGPILEEEVRLLDGLTEKSLDNLKECLAEEELQSRIFL